MEDTNKPYLKLKEVREADVDEANVLFEEGWVFIGYFSRTRVPDFGSSFDKSYQEPVLILGKPDPVQDL